MSARTLSVFSGRSLFLFQGNLIREKAYPEYADGQSTKHCKKANRAAALVGFKGKEENQSKPGYGHHAGPAELVDLQRRLIELMVEENNQQTENDKQQLQRERYPAPEINNQCRANIEEAQNP